MAWNEFEEWCFRLTVTEDQGFHLLGQQPEIEPALIEQITRGAVTTTLAKHLRGIMNRIERSFRPTGPVTLTYLLKDPSQPVGDAASAKSEKHPNARSALDRLMEIAKTGALHPRIEHSPDNQWSWSDSEIKAWLSRAQRS